GLRVQTIRRQPPHRGGQSTVGHPFSEQVKHRRFCCHKGAIPLGIAPNMCRKSPEYWLAAGAIPSELAPYGLLILAALPDNFRHRVGDVVEIVLYRCEPGEQVEQRCGRLSFDDDVLVFFAHDPLLARQFERARNAHCVSLRHMQ
ncbi:MAG: hypothetical protein P4L66_02270, partial [Acetobacteraceae bacterium]|nr:hypothetical protein [Acetobacteraceae bacterium]